MALVQLPWRGHFRASAVPIVWTAFSMPKISKVTSDFSVASALSAEDFKQLASLGLKTVISFLPEREAASLSADQARRAATDAGLHYVNIPSSKHEVFTDTVVLAAAAVLTSAEGPVLAHCVSGQRALIIWAAAQARQRPVSAILQQLRSAGFDFEFLRDDLEAQADRATWSGGLKLPAAGFQTLSAQT